MILEEKRKTCDLQSCSMEDIIFSAYFKKTDYALIKYIVKLGTAANLWASLGGEILNISLMSIILLLSSERRPYSKTKRKLKLMHT